MQEEHQEQFSPVQLQPGHGGQLGVFNSVRHEKDILVLKDSEASRNEAVQ